MSSPQTRTPGPDRNPLEASERGSALTRPPITVRRSPSFFNYVQSSSDEDEFTDDDDDEGDERDDDEAGASTPDARPANDRVALPSSSSSAMRAIIVPASHPFIDLDKKSRQRAEFLGGRSDSEDENVLPLARVRTAPIAIPVASSPQVPKNIPSFINSSPLTTASLRRPSVLLHDDEDEDDDTPRPPKRPAPQPTSAPRAPPQPPKAPVSLTAGRNPPPKSPLARPQRDPPAAPMPHEESDSDSDLHLIANATKYRTAQPEPEPVVARVPAGIPRVGDQPGSLEQGGPVPPFQADAFVNELPTPPVIIPDAKHPISGVVPVHAAAAVRSILPSHGDRRATAIGELSDSDTEARGTSLDLLRARDDRVTADTIIDAHAADDNDEEDSDASEDEDGGANDDDVDDEDEAEPDEEDAADSYPDVEHGEDGDTDPGDDRDADVEDRNLDPRRKIPSLGRAPTNVSLGERFGAIPMLPVIIPAVPTSGAADSQAARGSTKPSARADVDSDEEKTEAERNARYVKRSRAQRATEKLNLVEDLVKLSKGPDGVKLPMTAEELREEPLSYVRHLYSTCWEQKEKAFDRRQIWDRFITVNSNIELTSTMLVPAADTKGWTEALVKQRDDIEFLLARMNSKKKSLCRTNPTAALVGLMANTFFAFAFPKIMGVVATFIENRKRNTQTHPNNLRKTVPPVAPPLHSFVPNAAQQPQPSTDRLASELEKMQSLVAGLQAQQLQMAQWMSTMAANMTTAASTGAAPVVVAQPLVPHANASRPPAPRVPPPSSPPAVYERKPYDPADLLGVLVNEEYDPEELERLRNADIGSSSMPATTIRLAAPPATSAPVPVVAPVIVPAAKPVPSRTSTATRRNGGLVLDVML